MPIKFIMMILLPSVVFCEFQEMELITRLTDYFNFDHHFFVLDSSADSTRFLDGSGLTPRTVYVRPSVYAEFNVDDFGEINSKTGFAIVVADSTEFEYVVTLLEAIPFIQHKKSMKVGIFFTHRSSVQELSGLFGWLKENDVTDTFAAIYPNSDATRCSYQKCSLNIFTLNDFGTVNLINVTDSATFDDYFQSINSNFHQHKLHFEGFYWGGSDENVWLTVFRMMNASYEEPQNTYYTTPFEAYKNGLDIVKELHAVYDPVLIHVYPIALRRLVVLVPEALPYSEYWAYLKNGISVNLLIYSFISTVASIVTLIVIRCIKHQKRFVILRSIADVFNLLVYDNGYINYRKLFHAELFVIVALTIAGFVAVNGVLSDLKSHLMRPVLQPQIDTLDDIHSSSYQVYTYQPDWKYNILSEFESQTKYKDWIKRIVVLQGIIQRYIESYDRSMIVVLLLDEANILLEVQKRLNIKGYHQAQIVFSPVLFSYYVHPRFLYFERLNTILHRLKSAGLYQLWARRDFVLEEKNIITKNLKRLRNDKPISMEHNEFPTSIVYGWIMGFIVFISEIIWNKIAPKPVYELR